MKLLGFIDDDQYLACGDRFTLVLGQNDSGKSRLLETLRRVLAPRPDDRWADPGLPVVFFELNDQEQRFLFAGTNQTNRELEIVDGVFGANFGEDARDGDSWGNRDGWDWKPLACKWLTNTSSLLLEASLDPLLGALSESSVFALKPEASSWIHDAPPIRAFSVFWCLERPRWEQLESQDGIRNARKRADDQFAVLNPEPANDRFVDAPNPSPEIEAPDLNQVNDPTGTMPQPIVEVGAISRLSRVLPVTVPIEANALELMLEGAVERMTDYWTLIYEPETARLPAGANLWLESVDDPTGVAEKAVVISPRVISALQAINVEVNSQLPAFVSRKYEVALRIRPIYDWDAKGRISIELKSIDGSLNIYWYDPVRDLRSVTQSFSHSQLAEGYKMWFQFAVLRGIQVACRNASEALEASETLLINLPEFLGIDLYLLDEPERHLHAGLQREAARWLRQLLDETGEQAFIVSHSPAFISEMSATDSLVYVRNRSARNISRFELDAAHEPARDLGLTRGELLTLVRCLLVVEGLTDQAVLETLFGDQLRRAGVQVVPIHGHYRTSTAVIDIGSLLLRFTDAAIAVWLDSVPSAFVTKLTASPDAAPELRKSAPTQEAASIASLVELAPRHAVRVEPIANPASDILFLLDEDSVREVFPKYPGHRGAQIVKEDKHSKERNSEWFRRLLGKEKAPGAYVDIANAMIRSSIPPDATLNDVVGRCSELAGSIDERPEWLPID